MSDYLKRLIEEAESGLLDWDKGLEEELAPDKENAIIADSFDKLAWEMLNSTTPALGKETDRLVESVGETLAQAMQDLFNLLHQGDPRFTPENEMLPEFTITLYVLRNLAETEEFKQLYAETRYDEYQTAFAMLGLEEALREAFGSVEEQRQRAAEAAQRQQEAMQALAEAAQHAQQAQDSGQGQDQAAEALQQALDQAQQAGDTQAQAQQAQEQAAQQATADLAQAALQAKEDIDAEKAMMSGYGVEPGELTKMPFEERRKLAQRLSKARIAKLSNLLGAFRRFADAERRRKVKYAPSEVYDYDLSNDLTRLTSQELTNLAVPELEEQFWVRWSRHALLTKKVRGPERQGKGPIIVVCDESSSMDVALDAEGNTREAWSKAVALALCDAAKRGKRDFTYIGFASLGQQWRIDFRGGVTPIEKVIEFTEHMFNGGTHYERPLTMAMDLVDEYDKTGRSKPDIVFITDDECRVSDEFVDEWRKAKDKADVTVFGIQVGGGSGYQNAMHLLSDRCINITALNATPEGVQDLFRTI